MTGVRFQPERFANPVYLLNLLYLGLGACALCYVTWNVAVRILGAVRTSVYLYMIPVITIVTSAIVLHEPITWMTCLGTALTLAGLRFDAPRAVGRHAERNAGAMAPQHRKISKRDTKFLFGMLK
ncbi:MAG: EamA family transporter [Oscillospiraceae bacterium]|nr:EamA family transporter [Oscillospiraceae bacterium]